MSGEAVARLILLDLKRRSSSCRGHSVARSRTAIFIIARRQLASDCLRCVHIHARIIQGRSFGKSRASMVVRVPRLEGRSNTLNRLRCLLQVRRYTIYIEYHFKKIITDVICITIKSGTKKLLKEEMNI